MSATTTFACPGCGTTLPGTTRRCPACGIRLYGDLAIALWRVDQQIADLQRRRTELVVALRGDVPSPERSPRGVETRRTLLWLGAICLTAALTAGTALLWPALGPAGQAAVLVAVTVALFALALRLDHLPATAEAVAAVAVAAVGVDAVAGRRLLLADVPADAGRGYWIASAVAAAAVLWCIGRLRPRLAAPAVGAVVAALLVVLAAVSPQRVEDLAVVGALAAAVAFAIWSTADVLGVHVRAVRLTALAGGSTAAAIGAVASISAAVEHDPVLWCGVALAAAGAAWRTTALPAGAFAGLLLVLARVVPSVDRPVVVVAIAAPLLVVWWRHPVARWAAGFAATAAAVGLVSAQSQVLAGHRLLAGAAVAAIAASIVGAHARRLPAVAAPTAAGLLLVAVAEAAGTHGAIASATATAAVAVSLLAGSLLWETPVTAVAGAFAVVSVEADLALHQVHQPESYAAAPAVVLLVIAATRMWRRPTVSSRVLVPGLVAALLPSTSLAVGGDVGRQAAVLAVAAAVVAAGAQLRLAALLEVGGTAMLLVVASVLGPHIVVLPRWVSLGTVGAALLVLGSTWERRLQEMRAVADRVRPAVARLR